MPGELRLTGHGETEWSRSAAHPGRTDLPLTEAGREEASAIAGRLAGKRFALVLASPLQRALETCRLAGYGDVAQIEPNLIEWDYGDYEGRTTADIRKEVPGWNLWIAGFTRGQTTDQAAAKAAAATDRA